MNLDAALNADRQRRAEKESVQMSGTLLTGTIDVRAGEFRGVANFPQTFNGEPVVTFGFKVAPGTPFPAGYYPEFNVMVTKFIVKERPLQVTDLIVGFEYAGSLYGGSSESGTFSSLKGQIGWIAVGEAFVGGV